MRLNTQENSIESLKSSLGILIGMRFTTRMSRRLGPVSGLELCHDVIG